MSEVKNQLGCGRGWAFATAGAIEGFNPSDRHGIGIGTLSLQELIDYADHDTKDERAYGGGSMSLNAFDYVPNNGGLHSESAYPYKGVQGTCIRTP
ncbi:hypothetical protein R1flu_007767 [Riccia fluitans]|uniref:Peptidase C1A papain C-terminal domain-containing protein n=1 Tax=Riccia fluitans TaxID=41844 RepID=A0ABD1YZT3_9MARC